jgi:hypothetical protein
VLIPVFGRLQHPAMIGAIEVVARRTVWYGEYLGVTSTERAVLCSCTQRKQLGQPHYEYDAH